MTTTFLDDAGNAAIIAELNGAGRKPQTDDELVAALAEHYGLTVELAAATLAGDPTDVVVVP